MSPEEERVELQDPSGDAALEFEQEEAAMPYEPEEGEEMDSEATQIVQRHEQELLAIDGVEGTGVQTSEIGDDMIVVYIRDAGVRGKLPKTLEGVEVRGVVSGLIDAY